MWQARTIYETIDFQRKIEPKDAMGTGVALEVYIDKFVEELTKLKGNDGFPWSSYEDYVYGEIEALPALKAKIDNFRKEGFDPYECAHECQRHFKKGWRI